MTACAIGVHERLLSCSHRNGTLCGSPVGCISIHRCLNHTVCGILRQILDLVGLVGIQRHSDHAGRRDRDRTGACAAILIRLFERIAGVKAHALRRSKRDRELEFLRVVGRALNRLMDFQVTDIYIVCDFRLGHRCRA